MVRPARNYVGQVDGADGQSITGWALDLSDAEPIEITVWRAGQNIETCKCDLFRGDLVNAGFPKRAMGFRVHLTNPIADLKEYDVCFDRSRLRLRWSKNNP